MDVNISNKIQCFAHSEYCIGIWNHKKPAFEVCRHWKTLDMCAAGLRHLDLLYGSGGWTVGCPAQAEAEPLLLARLQTKCVKIIFL